MMISKTPHITKDNIKLDEAAAFVDILMSFIM